MSGCFLTGQRYHLMLSSTPLPALPRCPPIVQGLFSRATVGTNLGVAGRLATPDASASGQTEGESV